MATPDRGERLEAALRALREDVDGSSPSAPRTLGLALLASRRRARVRTGRVVLLAAAALVLVSAAWAAWSARPIPEGRSTPAPSIPAIGTSARSGLASAAPPVDEPADPRREPPPALSPPSAAASHAASVPPRAPAPAPAPAPPSPELEAYERAHRAHFEQRNPQAALSLWNDLLARYPGTRWGLEARYNRAICLLRLGRVAEARAELAPFASGAYGGYRQREAARLLDANPEPR